MFKTFFKVVVAIGTALLAVFGTVLPTQASHALLPACNTGASLYILRAQACISSGGHGAGLAVSSGTNVIFKLASPSSALNLRRCQAEIRVWAHKGFTSILEDSWTSDCTKEALVGGIPHIPPDRGTLSCRAGWEYNTQFDINLYFNDEPPSDIGHGIRVFSPRRIC